MKKLACLLFLTFVSSSLWAAPPSRLYDYTPLTTIVSSQVEANENAIFNYLTAGVEVYKDATIVNADVSASASIAASKLDLTTIAQNISNTGTLSNVGAFTVTGATSITGNETVVGGLTVTSGSTLAAVTATSYALSSGNTVVNHVGAEAQGDVLYFDGTNWRTLIAGVSGQFLKTQGAAANPAWASVVEYVPTYVADVNKAVIIASAPTERSNASGAYAKKKEITVDGGGVILVSFGLKKSGGTNAFGRIYKDGVAVGTERSTSSSTYVVYDEGISVSKDEKLQLYTYADGGGTGVVNNFNFYATTLTVDID